MLTELNSCRYFYDIGRVNTGFPVTSIIRTFSLALEAYDHVVGYVAIL
jgi:hypothetical protein